MRLTFPPEWAVSTSLTSVSPARFNSSGIPGRAASDVRGAGECPGRAGEGAAADRQRAAASTRAKGIASLPNLRHASRLKLVYLSAALPVKVETSQAGEREFELPNAEAKSRGRLLELEARETSIAAPVGCNASFGLISLTHLKKALVSSSWFSRSFKMASASRSTSAGPPKGVTGGDWLRLFCL